MLMGVEEVSEEKKERSSEEEERTMDEKSKVEWRTNRVE